MLHKVFDRKQLELCFKDLASALRKRLRGKGYSCELVVVGGASILLNYSFRETTIDIDCLDVDGALMNEIVSEIAIRYNLSTDWINTDFTKTSSFTPKIIQYSTFYKSYGNGVLNVRTIKDEYLIAMKMNSSRPYVHDFSDIVGIIKNSDSKITINKIEEAIINLYGSIDLIDKNVIDFVKRVIDNEIDYSDIVDRESKNKARLIDSDNQIEELIYLKNNFSIPKKK